MLALFVNLDDASPPVRVLMRSSQRRRHDPVVNLVSHETIVLSTTTSPGADGDRHATRNGDAATLPSVSPDDAPERQLQRSNRRRLRCRSCVLAVAVSSRLDGRVT